MKALACCPNAMFYVRKDDQSMIQGMEFRNLWNNAPLAMKMSNLLQCIDQRSNPGMLPQLKGLYSLLQHIKDGCIFKKTCSGRIFTKCNLVRAVRGFQPITARVTFRVIDEARLATSYLYEASLVQSSGLLRNAFSVVTVQINLQD